MFLTIAPPTPTGLALKPVAQASRALTAVVAVNAAMPSRHALADERPTRPLTQTALSLHLMRVPASRLADVYSEMKSLGDEAPAAHRDGEGARGTSLHLRA